ncbi:unnamed protein product [Acanthosepion pharaonis]|uniref:Protein tyrosine phosphatase n=1 Tax=Acanthosepion pharaonis TaxID=158019 RepID=A0A812CST7_ACAPH|nr:unnamed protein product [Sepia pharaonis]
MVWEQQGRVIVMLTDMDERGMPKGTPYCPDAEDISSIRLYGDHEVILKTKDFKQEYIASTLELKDMENNLVRKLKHFWYTSWPAHGFPEPISLVKFILDVRLQNEEKLAPLIVHCSSGTGRTGTFVAIDSGIKMFDKSHTVDILNCVYRMRLERPRAVQTKQQYALIYKALLEYASMVVSPSTSSTSSRATGNAVTFSFLHSIFHSISFNFLYFFPLVSFNQFFFHSDISNSSFSFLHSIVLSAYLYFFSLSLFFLHFFPLSTFVLSVFIQFFSLFFYSVFLSA